MGKLPGQYIVGTRNGVPVYSNTPPQQKNVWDDVIAEHMAKKGLTVGGEPLAAATPSIDDLAAADRAAIERLTEGAREDILSDPYLDRVLSQYVSQMDSGGPYSDAVAQAMRELGYRGLRETAGQRRAGVDTMLEAQGLDPTDPAYIAAQNAIASDEALGRSAVDQDVLAKGALTNWDAMSGAAGNLTNARLAQLAQANQMGLAGAGYRAQRSYEDPNNAANAMNLANQMRGMQPVFNPPAPGPMPQIPKFEPLQTPAAPDYARTRKESGVERAYTPPKQKQQANQQAQVDPIPSLYDVDAWARIYENSSLAQPQPPAVQAPPPIGPLYDPKAWANVPNGPEDRPYNVNTWDNFDPDKKNWWDDPDETERFLRNSGALDF